VASKDKGVAVSESSKHNLFRLFLYGGIFLIILHFFNIIIDANKKITYIEQAKLDIKTIKKATVLDGDKNLLIETQNDTLYIVPDFDRQALEQNGISYGHENKTFDEVSKYTLSILLFIFVLLLALT
jgi:hypothetical protein